MSFNAIRENKILAKISEFTVVLARKLLSMKLIGPLLSINVLYLFGYKNVCFPFQNKYEC